MVTGVDLSKGMIDLAEKQEAEHRLGIGYLVGDARSLNLAAEYDIVVAAYLLNYARSREELKSMCGGIAKCLKPGGRFVTANCNPALHFPTAPSYRKYGFETSVAGEFREGSPIKWTFFLEDSSFEIENYYLDVAIHEESLRSAGFREIHWHRPRVSPQGEAEYGDDFWTTFLSQSPATFIECVK